MKKSFIVLATILVAAILSGCVVYETHRRPAPPAARVEVIGIAPYPEAIWVPGIWVWHSRHREYRWKDGHWKRQGRYHHRHHRD